MRIIKNTTLNLGMALLLIMSFSFSSGTKSNGDSVSKPNVIIFFADDMGYGDLGCYGNPNIKTPHIDQLANDGLRLTSFYVAGPVCTPSRAGLLSGRYPIYTLPGNIGPESTKGFPTDELIIPALLKEAGYTSMAVGKWHLGHATKDVLPTGLGFDKFYGLPYSNDMIKPWVETDIPLQMYVDDQPVRTVNYDQEQLTTEYTTVAQTFIKENQDKPFFLYVPYSMPHLPISTSDEFKGQSKGGLYGDVIEHIDWSVGEIIHTLKETGALDNTLVIFTSDNGPWHELPDRMLARGVQPWHQGTAGTLKGSKAGTYEGGMRVPGIFYWKNKIPAGQVSSDIVTTMDIFPTLLEVSGVSKPSEKQFDGLNILPFLQGEAPSPRNEFYYLRGRTVEAVREGQWKLRYTHHRKDNIDETAPIEVELFNLNHDVSEKFNVATQHPEMVQHLMDKLKAKAKEMNGRICRPAKKKK